MRKEGGYDAWDYGVTWFQARKYVFSMGFERGEIPPAGGRRYLGALPGGGLQIDDSQPPGLTALLSVSATRRPRASSRPPYDENSQLLSQPAVSHIFAERARFELAIPFWGTHAFQACLFSHSSISPGRFPKKPDYKGSKKNENYKVSCFNFSM